MESALDNTTDSIQPKDSIGDDHASGSGDNDRKVNNKHNCVSLTMC